MNALTAINTSPVITYRWLGVNDCTINKELHPQLNSERKHTNPSGLRIESIDSNNALEYLSSTAPMGAAFREYVEANTQHGQEIIIDHSLSEPAVIEYVLQQESLVLKENVVIEENIQGTIIFLYRGEGSLLGIRQIVAKAGSKVKVIKVNLLKGASLDVSETIVKAEANAEIEVLHINMGEDSTVDNINISLAQNATGNITGLYLGGNKDKIDLNYSVAHYGEKSNSNIQVKGALFDNAEKIFRGTIDFKKGAKGSNGKEGEEVMLLSPHVRSRVLPLILCQEDDVVGEHAASCGRIDEDKLFYLMTRGLSLEESKKIVIEGNFNPILDQIPDPELLAEVKEMIQRRLV